MAGVDVVSSAISPLVNLTHGLTGLRLTQADGRAIVETGQYHLELDAAGLRVQDTRTQAWLGSEGLPVSNDPVTLALADGTKVTLAWLLGEAEPETPLRLSTATITRGDESIVVRVVEDGPASVDAQKHQGLASLWADAAQPDGQVLHAPTEHDPPAANAEAVPVLRWVSAEGATPGADRPDEAQRLRAELYGVIRHTLVAGRAHAALPEETDDDHARLEDAKLQRWMSRRGDAESAAAGEVDKKRDDRAHDAIRHF